MKEIIIIIFAIIGYAQFFTIIYSFGMALGKTGITNKWKNPDLFWQNRLEDFFVRLLTRIGKKKDEN